MDSAAATLLVFLQRKGVGLVALCHECCPLHVLICFVILKKHSYEPQKEENKNNISLQPQLNLIFIGLNADRIL